jgi:hypothetical protein
MDTFIGRHLSELIEAKSSPQEDPHVQVPRIFLDETIRCMEEAVHGRTIDFVFNPDIRVGGFQTKKREWFP